MRAERLDEPWFETLAEAQDSIKPEFPTWTPYRHIVCFPCHRHNAFVARSSLVPLEPATPTQWPRSGARYFLAPMYETRAGLWRPFNQMKPALI